MFRVTIFGQLSGFFRAVGCGARGEGSVGRYDLHEGGELDGGFGVHVIGALVVEVGVFMLEVDCGREGGEEKDGDGGVLHLDSIGSRSAV